MKCIVCHGIFRTELSLFNYYRPNELLCPACSSQLICTDVRRCSYCRKVLSADEQDCRDCEFMSRYFDPLDGINCLFDYNDFMKELIAQYKYRNDVKLSLLFANILQQQKMEGQIIPVPTSEEKLKQRGFEHMRLIVEAARLTSSDVLKMESRKKQAELTKLERLHEQNPFYIEGEVPERVTLIDDIYTTGLTVHRAAEQLKQAGCKKVKVLTFARA